MTNGDGYTHNMQTNRNDKGKKPMDPSGSCGISIDKSNFYNTEEFRSRHRAGIRFKDLELYTPNNPTSPTTPTNLILSDITNVSRTERNNGRVVKDVATTDLEYTVSKKRVAQYKGKTRTRNVKSMSSTDTNDKKSYKRNREVTYNNVAANCEDANSYEIDGLHSIGSVQNIYANTFYETNKSSSIRTGKMISKSQKTIHSVARDLDMDSKPVTLVDEDLQTIREITSDSGESEYVSNDETFTDSNDDDEYDDLGDQSYECQSCGAMMWYGERIIKQKGTSNPKFSMCCNGGKVELPNLIEAPDPLKILLFGTDRRSKHFQEHIRSYNMMFSFTSIGGKIQTTINRGSGPYTFLLHGQNYHLMGSLSPDEGSRPKFAQLYIFDTENEVKNRMDAVRSGDSSSELDPEIVSTLKDMVDSSNMLAQSYRAARDRLSQTGMEYVKLRLIKKRNTDGRTYNLPNSSEIAGLIYPLIFPHGEDGYRDDIPLMETSVSGTRIRKKLTMRQYFAYRIQKRFGDSAVLLHSKKLCQQFMVDAFSMVESERLKFIRFNQDKLRVDMYKGIEESILKGDTDARSIGHEGYSTRQFYPRSKIHWPEIQRAMRGTNLRPEDRPDILARVFKMKLDSLMSDLKKGKIFGRIRAYVFTIEFQKRGHPHAHILILLHNEDKPKTSKDIDKII
ncbi:PREDICTED: uncharacterized protein LOC105972131 [Erythranthe guttata]|uniref:uncharacterized protein LOC105972131 n=1 Tax=Erythranthe guttata TaxID=4155 RepID=UPI00064DE0BC|nr:PREDICTED: uncharacterized protein LOC105972131 [Erythranthe guttata]|eukprot:XP_012852527.1 PREDICTED: uncharacterized protein LOC105972131 [Erythranthe guttata]